MYFFIIYGNYGTGSRKVAHLEIPVTVWVTTLIEGLHQKIHLHPGHLQLEKHTPSELGFCCSCSQN